jgi:hypothetical protein
MGRDDSRQFRRQNPSALSNNPLGAALAKELDDIGGSSFCYLFQSAPHVHLLYHHHLKLDL